MSSVTGQEHSGNVTEHRTPTGEFAPVLRIRGVGAVHHNGQQ